MEVGAGPWEETANKRFKSLWRSGRKSKVAGGGRGDTDGCGTRAGVAEPVGGREARAETSAWGVTGADIGPEEGKTSKEEEEVEEVEAVKNRDVFE